MASLCTSIWLGVSARKKTESDFTWERKKTPFLSCLLLGAVVAAFPAIFSDPCHVIFATLSPCEKCPVGGQAGTEKQCVTLHFVKNPVNSATDSSQRAKQWASEATKTRVREEFMWWCFISIKSRLLWIFFSKGIVFYVVWESIWRFISANMERKSNLFQQNNTSVFVWFVLFCVTCKIVLFVVGGTCNTKVVSSSNLK